MNRQDAILKLEALKLFIASEEYVEALNMAIASLEIDEAYQLEYEQQQGENT